MSRRYKTMMKKPNYLRSNNSVNLYGNVQIICVAKLNKKKLYTLYTIIIFYITDVLKITIFMRLFLIEFYNNLFLYTQWKKAT